MKESNIPEPSDSEVCYEDDEEKQIISNDNPRNLDILNPNENTEYQMIDRIKQ